MIKVKIFKDNEDNIRRYSIKGHSNYDEYGKDIVCAAVSALAQTTLLSLVEVCKLEENTIKYSIEEKTGFLDVELPKDMERAKLDNTQILLKSLVVGINSIIDSYPKHVTLKMGRCN